jgi:hypothetical protein
MTYFSAKTLGIEAVSQLSFMGRPGIYWRWGTSLFNGKVFGSFLGATHCFFSGGFHEFGHCVDFILRGKASRITADGLILKQKYMEYVPAFDSWDGAPVTAQMTRNEAMALAFEAYFQIKEMGFAVNSVPHSEVALLRQKGLLDHIHFLEEPEFGLRPRILRPCSVQEFAHDKRDLYNVSWSDGSNFLLESGYPVESMKLDARRQAWKDCFEQAVLDAYSLLCAPGMESKISAAIDQLSLLMQAAQTEDGFVAGIEYIGQHAPFYGLEGQHQNQGVHHD